MDERQVKIMVEGNEVEDISTRSEELTIKPKR
jgi:hypothetical protein